MVQIFCVVVYKRGLAKCFLTISGTREEIYRRAKKMGYEYCTFWDWGMMCLDYGSCPWQKDENLWVPLGPSQDQAVYNVLKHGEDGSPFGPDCKANRDYRWAGNDQWVFIHRPWWVKKHFVLLQLTETRK